MKVRVADRMAQVILNPCADFSLGFLIGLVSGLWDGLTGPSSCSGTWPSWIPDPSGADAVPVQPRARRNPTADGPRRRSGTRCHRTQSARGSGRSDVGSDRPAAD